MRLQRSFGLCVVLTLPLAGCSWNAVRPPTPAAHLDSATLNYASPGERCYALIFASQTVPRRPAEAHTISWVPATLDIQPLCLCVEQGVNLNLYDAIRYAQSNGERVSMWGPYE